MIEVPKPFPYTSNKTIPWDYHCNYANETAAINLTGVGGITRTGCVYMPAITDKVAPERPSTLTEKEQASQEKEYGSIFGKKSQPIVEKKACEFLKFIKHSEYSVVEQLNKMPARISMLSLLQNSDFHRNAHLNALDKAYMAQNIFVEGIDQLVGNIIVGAFIAFSNEEIPPKGKESAKVLHITIKCKNYILPRALLDNNSSLNVIPMSTS